jgi:hypothetical protein
MATGGIFTLITNDGKQDRMLMATAFLSSRLASIRAARASNPATANDPTPTLLDIERTHVLFTNAHFKPFAAIGFEYNKVRTNSGNPALGQEVQFSIPQFGDFFHDMALRVVIPAPTLTVDAETADEDTPAVQWTTYPGERLLSQVSFQVNGNPLDEYTSHTYCFNREFQLPPNKVVGYNRLVGQENPHQGYVAQPNGLGNGQLPQSYRCGMQVYDGAQTPKAGSAVGGLELFVPLLFWFNRDVRLAIPSVAIPYGQRFINVHLAPVNDLVDVVPRGSGTWANPNGSVTVSGNITVELYINNIFVNPDIHNIYIQRIGFSLIRVHRQQLYPANKAEDQVLLQQLKWPIEYLYVGMKLTDYFNSSNATTKRQNLQKWQLFHKVTDTSLGVGKDCDKWRPATDPAATVAVATTGVVTGVTTLFTGNDDTTLDVAVGDTLVVNGVSYLVTVVTSATSLTVSPAPTAAVAATADWYVTKKCLQVEVELPTPTLNTLKVEAHGIPIYQEYPAQFFNSWTAYHYGGPNLNTPVDIGACFIPFCLYPNTYQPSGHINVSRAREFFLSYTSSVVNSETNGTLVVVASAINFLLISDGSAILRYST